MLKNRLKSDKGLMILLASLTGFMILNYSVIFFFNQENLFLWTREDGFVESLGAVFYLVATITAIITFFKSARTGDSFLLNAKHNYFYLLLALLFFFCFGEEISWGQRIFHIKTPEYISELNAQQEINIHNLNIFHGRDEANQRKTGIEVWYSLGRIFSLFWFTYCLLFPLLDRNIPKVSRLFSRLALPVTSVWLGILMVLNYGFPKIIENQNPYWVNRAATEIKEANLAILFLAVSWLFFLEIRRRTELNRKSLT